MLLHRALVLLLIAASGVRPAQGELPEGYHKVIGGLASRLVAESTYEEGSWIFLHLDVFNAGDAALEVAGGDGPSDRLQLMDEKGNPLTLRKRTQGGWSPHIAPGKQRQILTFYVSGNENAMFEPLKPGRYRAVWPGPEEQADYLVPQPPESNGVTFEVVPKKDVRPVFGSEVDDVTWGQERGGLRTRVRATRNCFYAGTPVPVVVEMENVGKKMLNYVAPGLAFDVELRVLRDGSEDVPDLGGGSSQPGNLTRPIEPGKTVTLEELDVTGLYLVQKPGRYTAQFLGWKADESDVSDIPSSNTFDFEILASAISDPQERAVGVLFDACPNSWRLGADRHPRLPENLRQPGAQWSRVPCRSYCFRHDRPCGQCPRNRGLARHRREYGVVVWIATRKAVVEPWDMGKWDGTEWKPEEQEEQEARMSDYLGLSPFGHVYLGRLHKTSLKCWPTAKEDIIRWLRVK